MAISIKVVDNQCVFIVNEQLIQSKMAIIINIGNMNRRYSQIWEYGLINHTHNNNEYFDLQRFIDNGIMVFHFNFNESNVKNIISTFSQNDMRKIQDCLRKLIKYRTVL